MATNENLPPNVIRQLAKELKNLDDSPPEGIKVSVNDDDFTTIFADIEGPGFFLTKIFHPNLALVVVRCLMIEPFPESALNEQAGKMLLENYEEYARHARLYTGIHALKPKNKSKNGAISESTTALNVGQSNTVLGENTPLASTAISTSAVAKALGASTAPKKDAPHAAKVPVDKKKLDARKKSLKRL
ncbi:ubiquitin-conjugating enzyme E2 22-like [Panicum miliaceum]|uniref:Ubiquitin-conjugating enzyme E2 22-like n=1 Tax=Panicum miliaceum TaxID=4540 RepID=A0A3L6S4I7_PANMI|nr:ubiquitin-conjugating enzyme E2 22-like [Panicum miliaceum]